MTSRAQTHSDLSSSADVVVVGRLGSRVDVRELPSGDTVTVFTIRGLGSRIVREA